MAFLQTVRSFLRVGELAVFAVLVGAVGGCSSPGEIVRMTGGDTGLGGDGQANAGVTSTAGNATPNSGGSGLGGVSADGGSIPDVGGGPAGLGGGPAGGNGPASGGVPLGSGGDEAAGGRPTGGGPASGGSGGSTEQGGVADQGGLGNGGSTSDGGVLGAGGDVPQAGCSATSTTCPDGCFDLDSDPTHCGDCTKACAEGQYCDAGRCRCPEGQVVCFGACHLPAECTAIAGSYENAGGGSSVSGFTGVSEACEADAPVYTATATWYELPTNLVNCSYKGTELGTFVAAIAGQQYADSATCGACVEVTCTDTRADVCLGTPVITVQIVDNCAAEQNPTHCFDGSYHIDLNKPAFAEMVGGTEAAGRVGVMDISWRYVPCPAELVTGNLQYAIKDGSSPGWTGIAFKNYPIALTGVEVQARGGHVSTPVRMDYNYWVDTDGFGNGPYTVRVTNANGQTVTFTMPALGSELTGEPVFTETDVQFTGCAP